MGSSTSSCMEAEPSSSFLASRQQGHNFLSRNWWEKGSSTYGPGILDGQQQLCMQTVTQQSCLPPNAEGPAGGA